MIPTRSKLPLLALILAAACAHAAKQQTTPPVVASAQAFRCQDEAGHLQYQQWACPDSAQAQEVNIRDARTADQRTQAHRMAVRDQTLARHVSFVRKQEERRSLASTEKAKRLTVVPRQVAATTPAQTQGVTIAPHKRDFRAVSAKAEKHPKQTKGVNEGKAQSSNQPT